MIEKIEIEGVPYTIVYASVIGKGKEENQDSIRVYFDDDKAIVVVCDGLGSARFSAEGSRKASSILLDFLKEEEIDYEAMPMSVLREWMKSVSGNPNLYDTTLKFIRISKDKVDFGGVGDGAIDILSDGKFHHFSPEHTFSNQTDTLMSFDLKKTFWRKEFPAKGFLSGMISTDGFSEDLDANAEKQFLRESASAVLKDPISFEADLEATLRDWPIKTNLDDKTVAFIIKGE